MGNFVKMEKLHNFGSFHSDSGRFEMFNRLRFLKSITFLKSIRVIDVAFKFQTA